MNIFRSFGASKSGAMRTHSKTLARTNARSKTPLGFGVRRIAPLFQRHWFSMSFLILFTLSTVAADRPANYKLLHEETFDTAASLDHFQCTDAGAWKFVATNDNHGGTMELVRQSKYQPI